MKYNKNNAFERLKIPSSLQKHVIIINIPRLICWLAKKIGVKKLTSGLHIYLFKINYVFIFASKELAHNDYTLAHELLGHRKQHQKLGNKYEEITRKEREAHATTEGLLAIKNIHKNYYKQFVKEIKDFKKGKASFWNKLRGQVYYKKINMHRLT